jgi:hypothetical protein
MRGLDKYAHQALHRFVKRFVKERDRHGRKQTERRQI